MIVRELQYFLKYLQRQLMKHEPFFKQLKSFVKAVDDPNTLICMLPVWREGGREGGRENSICDSIIVFPANAVKYYNQLLSPFLKVWGPFLDCVMKVCMCVSELSPSHQYHII